MGALSINWAQMEAIVTNGITEDETYIGGFYSQYQPGFGKMMLFGVFAILQMRVYLAGVSDRRIYFHRLNLLNKVECCDAFSYEEIAEYRCKKGLLTWKLFFKFDNGKKLILKSPVRKKGFYFNEPLMKYLEEKLPCRLSA
jgi:hypothetical protein